MSELVIAADDPRAGDVRALLERHLAFAFATTPAEDVHALPVDALAEPGVLFFSARADGRLLGVGALQHLDDRHAEIKSMHTAAAARGRGVARAVLAHLIGVARERGYRRVSLETGTEPEYEAARRLYLGAGFAPCAPFGGYRESPNSAYFTLALTEDAAA